MTHGGENRLYLVSRHPTKCQDFCWLLVVTMLTMLTVLTQTCRGDKFTLDSI